MTIRDYRKQMKRKARKAKLKAKRIERKKNDEYKEWVERKIEEMQDDHKNRKN